MWHCRRSGAKRQRSPCLSCRCGKADGRASLHRGGALMRLAEPADKCEGEVLVCDAYSRTGRPREGWCGAGKCTELPDIHRSCTSGCGRQVEFEAASLS